MRNKRFWVLLEGSDDQRFFEKVIKPIVSPPYVSAQTWQYAQQKRERTRNFLSAISKMSSDYLLWGDINDSPCVTARKDIIKAAYDDNLAVQNVIIVIREIEAWYLAGLSDKSCQELGLKPFQNTNAITKEHFNQLIPKKFDSRIDFMLEVLKRFDIETAKKKNKSFKYFLNKVETTFAE
jgi:hypothetical protein